MANGNGGGGDNDFKAVRAASVAEASQAADKKRIEDMLREPEGRADLTPDTRLDRWPNKGIHPVGLLVSLCRPPSWESKLKNGRRTTSLNRASIAGRSSHRAQLINTFLPWSGKGAISTSSIEQSGNSGLTAFCCGEAEQH